MLLVEILHLPPVKFKPIHACVDEHDKKILLSLNVCPMFQFVELTEVMREKGDAEFINLLNTIRIGDIVAGVQQKLNARFVNEAVDNCPQNDVHMFAENYTILFTTKGYFTNCQVNCTE